MADELGKKEAKKKPGIFETAAASVKSFIISTAVLLIVAKIFERITSTESLSWALAGAIDAQSRLAAAVNGLNPLHLGQYWLDAYSFMARALTFSPPQWITNLMKFPLELVLGFLSFVALPLVVLREGSPFEWVLVFGVYLPVFFRLKSGAIGKADIVPGQSLYYAFFLTMFFYWVVQLLFIGTLAVFHGFIQTAQLAVGGSVAASTVVWAVGKRGEHTVTERILQLFSRTREA